MKPIKAKSNRKYLAYNILEELPPLSDASFMTNSRVRQSSLQNSRLLQTTNNLAQHNQYIFIDMQQENPIRLCEKEQTLQSSDSDEDTQKIGNNFCIRDLENLSPGCRSMQKYMQMLRGDGKKKHDIRDFIKRRLSQISPKQEKKGATSPKVKNSRIRIRQKPSTVTPQKKSYLMNRSLEKREQLLVRKFGIKEDYYFLDQNQPQKLAPFVTKLNKTFTKIPTTMSNNEHKDSLKESKLPPVRLEKGSDNAQQGRIVQSSLV